MNSNRCPNCGGVANHIITDSDGRCYYRCATGLTSFERDKEGAIRVSRIVPCDTIIDSRGKRFTGTIAYDTDGRTRTLAVTAGKERR